jgi:hypothetical protein
MFSKDCVRDVFGRLCSMKFMLNAKITKVIPRTHRTIKDLAFQVFRRQLSGISLILGVADHLSIVHTTPSTIITSVRKFNNSNIHQIIFLMHGKNELFLDYVTNISPMMSAESVDNLVSYFLSSLTQLLHSVCPFIP